MHDCVALRLLCSFRRLPLHSNSRFQFQWRRETSRYENKKHEPVQSHGEVKGSEAENKRAVGGGVKWKRTPEAAEKSKIVKIVQVNENVKAIGKEVARMERWVDSLSSPLPGFPSPSYLYPVPSQLLLTLWMYPRLFVSASLFFFFFAASHCAIQNESITNQSII